MPRAEYGPYALPHGAGNIEQRRDKWLARWKSEQSVTQLPGYVFIGKGGGPLPLTSWQRYHKRLCAEAGVPLISLHALRHTAATLLMELGQHPRIVSEILGHQSIQITLDTYSHVSESMQKTDMETVEQSLSATIITTRLRESPGKH